MAKVFFFHKKVLQRQKSWGQVLCVEQGGVNTWKKDRQNTSILPQALHPELPCEVDFCKQISSTKSFLVKKTIYIYIYIYISPKITQKCLGVLGGHPRHIPSHIWSILANTIENRLKQNYENQYKNQVNLIAPRSTEYERIAFLVLATHDLYDLSFLDHEGIP